MKRSFWGLFLLLTVILSGCGGGQAVQAPAGAATAGGEVFQIALPRIVVDVDAEGNPSILGINPALLQALGVDTSGFQIPKATVAMLTKAGIQHFEIASVGDRLVLFANSKPLPHLGWSEDSLNRTLDVAAKFDVQSAPMLSKLLPMVTRLGLDVALRFPRQSGAAEIPLTATGVAKNLTVSPTKDPASAIIKFEVKFDENGLPGIMGVSAKDLQAMGMGGVSGLSPDMIQKLQKGNLQFMELRTRPDGTYIYVNGEPLPKLIWDSQLLANLVEVYAKVSPEAPLLPLIESMAPYMDRADVGILLHFPLAAGAAPIPAKMHD